MKSAGTFNHLKSGTVRSLFFSLRHTVSPSMSVRFSAVPLGAHVFDYNLRTVVTVYGAAPVKLAVAAAHHLSAPFLHSQAALMTQPAAAALLPLGYTLLVQHTLSVLGAMQPQAYVLLAVVRGVLQVDELCRRDAAQCVHDGALSVSAVTSTHALLFDVQFLGLTVFDFQIVSDFSEI